MPKIFQAYGIGQALIPVLPPPIAFENAPTSSQTNYSVGQIVYTPGPTASAFYIYAGAGDWINLTDSDGPIQSVAGTTNQVTVTTVSGVATVSLPSAITAPGSLTATTTLTATLGNITATNGNLVLGTAGNKVIIPTGANASVGTSAAMTAGAVTVSTTASSATAKIFYSRATTGGTTGDISITAQDGTGFTLTSTSNTETSTFNWWIINA